MFSLIKQVFIALLSFSESLGTKCVSLNDESCMVRPTLINFNPVKLKYYPFMVSLGKCTRSYNVLSSKICVPKETTKHINVEAFNMIARKNEARTMKKHISCDCKCKSNSATCNSNQKWNNQTCQCECKNYNNWNPRISICEKRKYLKSIADTSVITCDEIISAMDIVSTKMTNNIARNVSINSDGKKVRYKIDCYILHTVLLVIIFLLIITIICYH